MASKRTGMEKTDLYGDKGGRLNIFLKIAVLVYRHTILALDISVFLIKALSEYIRLSYRSFVPRPLRDIGGDVVLVTGAGHGIGKELALQMSRLGAIVLCVDKNMETNRSTAAEIRSEGGQSWVYQCDVSNREDVKTMAMKVRKEVGDVNILVNNAGIMITKQFLEQTDSEVESTINVNLMGQVWVLREFLPAMIEMNRGSIIFMCGLPGHAGAPNMVPYSASKFAIRGMMEALYIELRQTYPGNLIHLMLVSPFIVETGMVKRPRIRFQSIMGIVDVSTAATSIINSMRRRAAIVFLPDILYYVSNFVRMLPAKVQLLLTDFFDTGIDVCED